MDVKTIIIVIGILIFLYLLRSPNKKRPKGKNPNKSNELPEWLLDRWQGRLNGEAGFPSWYQDPATESQIDKIKETGIKPPPKLTKGTASDIIGLDFPPSEDELEFVRFFKEAKPRMSQTEAREKIRQIELDPEKCQQWEDRPPSTIEKEMFRFYGLKITKDTSRKEACEWLEQNPPTANQRNLWDAVEEVFAELGDKDEREMYEIRKPTPKQVLSAVIAIAQTKDKDDINDIGTVSEKLIDLYPKLRLE